MSDSDTTRDILPSINTAMGDLSVSSQTTPTNNKPATVIDGKSKAKKVDILLSATGNAPILKIRKWAVAADKPVSSIIGFIHRYLKLEPEEKLFFYVNQTFAPAPDQTVQNLYDCYGTNGKLILYYCKSQAWG